MNKLTIDYIMKQLFINLAATAMLTLGSASLLSAQHVVHERLISFEGKEIPSVFEGKKSKLSLSDLHYKDGKQSMLWQFEPGGELILNKELQFELKDPTGKDLYLSAFIVWIYNEKAMDEAIQFQFFKDGQLCTSFPMNINFAGWRGAGVCYEHEVQCKALEGIDEMRIVAADAADALYIDHMIPA